ncbi:MAG TPA: YgiT-type zinc finger protein [Firmicutes bacterium]|nr:YgiT-type zinc finger protein [Bacillota bacterium]
MREKRVRVDYRLGDGLVIIEDVPAGVYEQCGEQYFTARVAKALEELAHSRDPAHRTATVPIKVFPARVSTLAAR